MKKRILAILLTTVMIIPSFGITANAALPTGSGATSLANGNIARAAGTVCTASYSNTTNGATATQTARIIDGTLAGGNWNSWNTNAFPITVTLTWTQPYVIDATRVMWWYDGTGSGSGVTLPGNTVVQYNAGTTENPVWQTVTNMKNADGNPVTTVGNAGGGLTSTNRIWNGVTFDPVATNQLRLSISKGVGIGVGIGEWEVFGMSNPALADLAAINLNFTDLKTSVSLPASGASGSTFVWSDSTVPAALSNDGTVNRPAIGSGDAVGTIKCTATNGDFIGERVFNFSVMSLKSDAETVAHDLAQLVLGDTSKVLANIHLHTIGEWGSKIFWDADASPFLWPDGTVIRPPAGMDDAVVTLTATVEFGTESKTKEFIVGIPALESARAIASYEPIVVNSPVGTVPRLPNYVKVTYTDGTTESRAVMWSNSSTATENAQAANPVGTRYTVTGNILGDTSISAGYQVTADVTVVLTPYKVPSNIPVAKTLPLTDVTLDGTNRLTANRTLDINMLAGINVTQMLYNYRDTFGLSTTGYTTPTGWDSPTTKLKGHGMGHYMSAASMAYLSATGTQKTTILNNLNRMIDEMREMQELTFVYDEGLGRYREARDYFPADVIGSKQGTWTAFNTYKTPEEFGYGYINAIPAAHPVLLEAYRGYDNTNWLWAPYYTIHKQIAGLIDVYQYTGNEKALAIAKDMGLWVWNRLNYRTYAGSSNSDSAYGSRYRMWGMYIAGEYGGMNESMARLAELTKDHIWQNPAYGVDIYAGDGSGKTTSDRLIEGATFFDNTGFFNNLKVNKDDIRTRHANQHLPQIIGAVWEFGGTNNPDYYNIAENFWNFNLGRYSYSPGGVGSGEMYRQPYTQIANLSGDINETCCVYNLAKLSKDLNSYNPDDAKYMDYYEKMLYNQIVGSARSTSYGVTYQYGVSLNASKPFGNANPSSTCCGGTGSESHVKYQEAAYFVSDDTIWVGLYMPTTAKWAAKGVTLNQNCLWPAESSTIKLTAGSANFTMKLRVPSWATSKFDIKLNGQSVAASYEPGTYIAIGPRDWSTSDTVVVTMPFGAHLDTAPDKHEGNWATTVMYGPLAMTANSGNAWRTLELDTYLADANKIKLNGADANNVYSMTVNGLTFQPDYYTTSNQTHYFHLNMVGDAGAEFKGPLFDKIQEAREYLDGAYTEETLSLLDAAIKAAAAVYQNELATEQMVNAQIEALDNAIIALDGTGPVDVTVLTNAVNAAITKVEADYTWDSFAALKAEILKGQAILAAAEPKQSAVNIQARAIDNAVKALVPITSIDKTALAQKLAEAIGKKAEDYTVKSFGVLQEAVAAAGLVHNNTVANQKEVDSAAETLTVAIAQLKWYYLCDDTEELEILIAEARGLKRGAYTSLTYAELAEAIANGQMVVEYCRDGSGTWDQRDNAVELLDKAIAGLVRIPYIDEENLALRIKWAAPSNNPTFSNGSITVSGGTAALTNNTWNRLTAVNNGVIGTTSNVSNAEAWGTWNTQYVFPIWIEYNFGIKGKMTHTSVFWNDNDTSLDSTGRAGDGGVKAPKSWTLQYFDYGTDGWKDVTLLDGETYGTDIDKLNDVWFEPVVSDRVRIVVPTANTPTEMGGKGNPGIVEWQVWGTGEDISVDGEIVAAVDSFSSIGTNYSAALSLVSYPKDRKLTLIVASYDEVGRLAGIVSTESVELKADVKTEVQLTVPKNTETTTYRFYLWDDSFRPVTGITSFSE